MIRFLIALVIVCLVTLPVDADVYVGGYYRSNGTYVQSHYRSDPDGCVYNNWSTYPNINPYTGKRGTKHYNTLTSHKLRQRLKQRRYYESKIRKILNESNIPVKAVRSKLSTTDYLKVNLGLSIVYSRGAFLELYFSDHPYMSQQEREEYAYQVLYEDAYTSLAQMELEEALKHYYELKIIDQITETL